GSSRCCSASCIAHPASLPCSPTRRSSDLLTHAHLAAGESVLIRGAAGSIGIAAIELAARSGARELAVTTSSAERGERLRELGARSEEHTSELQSRVDLGCRLLLVNEIHAL